MKKQRGGTLLGLIIGALIGLGIALTVAVYVTKVPVPFLNKGSSRSPDSDAVESKKNKDWNPNAPLAGKNPANAAPSASGELSPALPEAESGATVLDPVLIPAPGRAAKAPKPPSADPLGDLANSRAAGAPAASGSDPFNYFIQAGAFRTPEDAEQQRARLLLLGMQAKISEREQAGRTVYRVRIGPFDKKDSADKVKDRLDSNSIETALVRVQR